MIRVYCAGSYSADGIMAVLHNIRVGIWHSTEPLMAGFAVHCPWLDFQWCLTREIPIEVLQANSIAWLQVSDAVLLIPGWHNSKGTRAELAEASKLGLPVFETVDALKAWAAQKIEDEKRPRHPMCRCHVKPINIQVNMQDGYGTSIY